MTALTLSSLLEGHCKLNLVLGSFGALITPTRGRWGESWKGRKGYRVRHVLAANVGILDRGTGVCRYEGNISNISSLRCHSDAPPVYETALVETAPRKRLCFMVKDEALVLSLLLPL